MIRFPSSIPLEVCYLIIEWMLFLRSRQQRIKLHKRTEMEWNPSNYRHLNPVTWKGGTSRQYEVDGVTYTQVWFPWGDFAP